MHKTINIKDLRPSQIGKSLSFFGRKPLFPFALVVGRGLKIFFLKAGRKIGSAVKTS
jgi:hypothetical protein